MYYNDGIKRGGETGVLLSWLTVASQHSLGDFVLKL